MAYQCLLQKYVKHLIGLPRNVRALAERKGPFTSDPKPEELVVEDNSKTDEAEDKRQVGGWVRARLMRAKASESDKTPWNPKRHLTRYQMDHLRTLHSLYPNDWTKKKLATQFGISQTAVYRILHSKFVPSPEVAARQDTRARAAKQKRRFSKSNKLNTK